MRLLVQPCPTAAQPRSSPHRSTAAAPALAHWCILSLLLISLLHTASLHAVGAPRATSRVPVYRPDSSYHTYAQYKAAILAQMDRVANEPVMRTVVSKDKTHGGERLYLVQLANFYKDRVATVAAGDGAKGKEPQQQQQQQQQPRSFVPPLTPLSPERKLRVLLSFGEHAREFITVESFLALLDYVLQGSADARNDCAIVGADMPIDPHADEQAQRSDGVRLSQSRGYRARWSHWLLDFVELHLLGVTNPDGKMHVERSGDYCWRNTARGVDLNRNADWQWGKAGSSPDPQHEEYHGTAPFSEAETRFLRDMQRAHRYDAYVSVHSGEQQLFVPFVDTESKRIRRRRPSTDAELRLMHAVVRHPHLGAWLHDSGIGYEMNDYSADGTLFDWMAGVENVPRVFCVELYGGPIHEDCFVMFNPSPIPAPVVDAKGRAQVDAATGQALMQSPLDAALRRMHVFYVRMLNELVAEHYGVHYTDPAEILDAQQRQAALRRHQRICEIERTLYNQRNGAQQRTADSQSRVIMQT